MILKRRLLWMGSLAVCLAFAAGCVNQSPVAPIQPPSAGHGQVQAVEGDVTFDVEAPGVVSGTVTLTQGKKTLSAAVTCLDGTGTAVFPQVKVGHWKVEVVLNNAAGEPVFVGSGDIVVKPDRNRIKVHPGPVTGEVVIVVTYPPPTPTPVPVATAVIVFASNRDGYPNSIYTMPASGGAWVRLTGNLAAYEPNNYPGGHTLVFMQQNDTIWLVGMDGSDLRQVPGVSGRGPRWSEDGQRIAVHSYQGGTYQIATFRPDGSDFRVLTAGANGNFQPIWTPDGRIIYSRNDEPYADGKRTLMIMNADGSEARPITASFRRAYATDCSPSGQILFNHAESGQSQIYRLDLTTLAVTQLTDTHGSYEDVGAWYSADETKIVFQSNRDGWAPEIYLMDPDGSNQVNLTNSPTYDEGPSFLY